MNFNPILKVNNWTFYVNPKCGIRTVNRIYHKLKTLPNKIFKDKINIFIYRNPYNRLLSGYLNKYVQHDKYIEMLKSNNINEDDINTFGKFINIINNHGIHILDKSHFKPQVSIFNNKDNMVKIEKIFITEEMNYLIDYINSFIKKHNKSLLLVHSDFSKIDIKHNNNYHNNNIKSYNLTRSELLILIKENKVPSYESFYTEEFKKIIMKFYHDDFIFYKNNIN